MLFSDNASSIGARSTMLKRSIIGTSLLLIITMSALIPVTQSFGFRDHFSTVQLFAPKNDQAPSLFIPLLTANLVPRTVQSPMRESPTSWPKTNEATTNEATTNEATTNEDCETEQLSPGAIVLSPQDEWETIVTAPSSAGRTMLLRGGRYQATDKLWFPAGSPDHPTVIKPYNCEDVILQTSLRPSSHTLIAGLRIEASGIEDTKWAIRFDGKDRGGITNIIVRNNIILGGTIDAIRLNDDVRNVLIQGNHIDGGEEGHDIFVTGDPTGVQPDEITITQNRLTKRMFTGPSEDMIQVRDVGAVRITFNLCTDGLNMEQCIDIKNATTALYIAHNRFDGDRLHTVGKGEDGAGGCMVIHEDDGHAEQHIIENNQFRYCKETIIRFAPGTRPETSSALLRYNLFLQRENQDDTIPIEMATDVQFINNTFVGGVLKLGNSRQTRLPQRLLFQNNIFYKMTFTDHTRPDLPAYECTHNLIHQIIRDDFFPTSCTDTIQADPQFFDSTHEDFHLLLGSPALGVDINDGYIGALPVRHPFAALSPRHFLPLIMQ